MGPVLWPASGRKTPMKVDALAAYVDSDQDWLNATPAGNTSAITHAPAVSARVRPAGAPQMNRSTAYPAAIAVNHAPRPMCRYSAATVCRCACSTGPITAATASTASSQVCAAGARLTQLNTTPQTASTSTSPAQYQAWASTDTGDADPGTPVRMVIFTPAR